MKKIKHQNTFEEGILILQNEAKKFPISMGEILRVLPGKGHALILILLTLPFLQPIQIPGFSTPFGLLTAFIGLRISFGNRIWLPEYILQKQLPTGLIQKITNVALSMIKKIRHWIHPRISWMYQSTFMRVVNGLSITILGILLGLPLPIPLTNLVPAIAAFLFGLGLLEDDGLILIMGYFAFLTTIIYLAVLTFSLHYFLS